MYRSIGTLEVVGLTVAMACADQMLKTAFVEIKSVKRLTGGLVAITVTGDLASVQAAIEAGAENSLKNGAFFAMKVIARPYEEIHHLLSNDERSTAFEKN